MSLEYDLVVIGGSAAGIEAAIAAVSRQARVALVLQDVPSVDAGAIAHQVLLDLARKIRQVYQAERYGIVISESIRLPSGLDRAQQWAQGVAETIAAARSPAIVAALGVEVIAAVGEFVRKPVFGFRVPERVLRSRAYLLAMDDRAVKPDIQGLGVATPSGERLHADALTPNTLLQKPLADHFAIVGHDVRAIELAQALAWLGAQVTLITPESHLIPIADPEAAMLVQAQLEADGVQILTRTPVTQVRQIQTKTWVQAGKQAIETDQLLMFNDRQPNLASLNLAAANLDWKSGLWLDRYCRTAHPRIFACLGCHASHQAKIAVHNALFWPHRPAIAVPYTMQTEPECAWIGLTEPQAIQDYGTDVTIVRQFLTDLPQAQIQSSTTGFCKVITRRNGTILGAHSVGPQAGEIIATISLAMQHNQTLSTLADFAPSANSFSEILRRVAAEWSDQRSLQHSWRQNWLTAWLRLRRSWG